MGVYKEGKNWKVQVYYKDWQGNQKRKQKRGFRTKGEAKEWERDFLQQQSQGVDIEFGNFLEIYYKDMDVRLREHTMYTKRYIIDLKIRPYFEKKILSEITVADVRAWQNELLMYKDKNGKGYSQTYLKTINCQLTAIFNYAIRYYNLKDNPCRKAGAIGKSKGEPKDFWMQEEFNDFLETVSDKAETRMAFLLLYWTGMRIGELLALTYDDINLEEKTISITKSYQRLKGKDVITQPKTPKSVRIITMPDFLADEFREYCSHLYGIMKNERFPATLTLPFPEVVNGFMVQYQLAKMVKLAAPPVIIRGNFHLLTPFPWGVSRMILSVVRGLCWPWSADRLLFHLIFCRK